LEQFLLYLKSSHIPESEAVTQRNREFSVVSTRAAPGTHSWGGR